MNDDCLFCDKTKIKGLFAERRDQYINATPGQITDGGYLLVIQKEHASCLGALNREQTSSFLRTTKEVCQAISLEYQHSTTSTPYPVTAFEHGIIGQSIKHAHLHILPTVIDLTERIRADFPTAEIEELQYAAHLQEQYSKRQEPYLFWTVPSGKSMACWNPKAKPQYLRLITAELLKRPERGNWRTMDPELDEQLRTETIARLESHFSEKYL